MDYFEVARPNHTTTCVCDRCRFCTRKERFETVSRATYDPSLDPEPPPLATFRAKLEDEVLPAPVFAEEVGLAACDTLAA